MTEHGTETEVLTFQDVTLTDDAGRPLLSDIDLVLRAGELAIVKLANADARVAMIDACLGLHEPAAGTICYQGHDWQTTRDTPANDLRGTIGYTLFEPDWLGTVSTAENVILRPLHHTDRAPAEILAEARGIARDLGLDALPPGNPPDMNTNECHVATLVRALVGNPALVLLDKPTHDTGLAVMTGFLPRLASARGDGAAILWLTDKEHVWSEVAVDPTAQYRVLKSRFTRVA